MSDYLRLQESQTGLNLAAAYLGEAQALNRYTIYADLAAKSKQGVLSAVFTDTANDERAHAQLFYDYLTAGMNNIHPAQVVSVPITMGSLTENLAASIRYEHADCSDNYPAFARIALAERFETIADTFNALTTVERMHGNRYRDYLERLQTGRLYLSDAPAEFKCVNCGYRHYGTSAPDICPGCLRPREFFMLLHSNYEGPE